MSAAATNLRAGHRINALRIESVLGEGAFGVTYLATDTQTQRKVALKEYLPMDIATRNINQGVQARTKADTGTYQIGLTRFAEEARALGAVAHPNVVSLLDYFETNGTGYRVMELAIGVPLSTWSDTWNDTPRPIQQAQILDIIVPVLNALAVVHGKGYVHRDVKPTNIIVRDDGQPMLLDFGSASVVTSDDQRLTAIGSPGYAPVEQYDATSKQGAWSDIYAIGAVMYWMVSGRRPMDAIARVRQDVLTPAISFAREYPSCVYGEGFLGAIDKALTLNANDRPQSVAEFLRLLGVADDTRTVRLPPSGSTLATPQTIEFPPHQLRRIEIIAARELGPIAPMLVRKAARTSTTLLQLCTLVANEIKDDQARAAFLKLLVSGA